MEEPAWLIYDRQRYVHHGRSAWRPHVESCANKAHGLGAFRTRVRYIGKTLQDGIASAWATNEDGQPGIPRIAIISDDMDARASMSSLLVEGGYRPVAPTEERGAFLALARRPPRAILLTLRLVNAESYWIVLRLLRTMPSLGTVPVILCTPREPSLSAAAAELAALGGTILSIPFTADDMLRRLRLVLDAPSANPIDTATARRALGSLQSAGRGTER